MKTLEIQNQIKDSQDTLNKVKMLSSFENLVPKEKRECKKKIYSKFKFYI